MERFIQAFDGLSLWTVLEGSGPPVVLSCGGPGCCDYLGPVSELISGGATVLRWEQRGCGRSTADGNYELEVSLQDMEALRMAHGWETWTVAGHSWGANLSLAYALEYPSRVDAVIYIAGNGAQNDRDWHAAYETAQRERPEDLPAFEVPHNVEVNRIGNRSWRSWFRRPDFLRRIADLEVQILFVAAGEDIRPEWPARQLFELCQRAEWRTIEGAGHHIHLTHCSELGDTLGHFLASVRESDVAL